MNGKWSRIGLVVLAALAVGALALGGIALAQGPGNPDGSDDGQQGWGFFGRMQRSGGHMMGAGQGAHLDTIATLLGMTTDELTAALSDGTTTVAQLAEDRGVEVQTIVDALSAEMSAHMAAAVAAGRMTQAQADAKLTQMQAHLTARLSQPFGQGFMDADGDGICDGMGNGTHGGMMYGQGQMGRHGQHGGMLGRMMQGMGLR